jgi:hypothetical protein
MIATIVSPKSESKVRMSDLFPQMHFWEKLRATAICALLLVPAITVIWWAAGPKDPFSAVTFVYHDRPWLAFPVILAYAVVGSAVATLLMGGRLGGFGLFAAGVGLAGLSLCGGDLSVLLQYDAGAASRRAAVHGWLAIDVLLWTLVAAAGYAAGLITEIKAGFNGPNGQAPADGAKPRKNEGDGFLARYLQQAAARMGTSSEWSVELRHGLMTMVVTGVVALVVIRIAAGRYDGPVHAGQVCFAVGLGFWLGAMAANQICRPALSVWYCLPVPLVALIGHLGSWVSPDLPAELVRYTDIVTMVPNGLARGLPVDYLAIGPAAAILGIWTGHRVHRAREESAES